MKYLKISPEYQCSPLWVSLDGHIYKNLNIDNSPFDQILKTKLSGWAKNYEDTLSQDYPPDSGFSTLKAEEGFELAGFTIWNCIKQHYSNFFDTISFKSYKLEKLYSDISEYQRDLETFTSEIKKV